MKKLLFLFVLTLCFNLGFSQISFRDNDCLNTITSGDTIELQAETEFYFNIYNSYSDSIYYSFFVTDLILPDSCDGLSICANGTCAFPDRPMEVGDSTKVLPGECVLADVSYWPGNATGDVFMRIKVQNYFNPNDTAILYFVYNAANSVSNVAQNSKLNLYPNPVNDILTIDFDLNSDKKFDIINSNGVLIQTLNVNSSTGIIFLNVAYLQNGVYFIRSKNILKKFVVNHK